MGKNISRNGDRAGRKPSGGERLAPTELKEEELEINTVEEVYLSPDDKKKLWALFLALGAAREIRKPDEGTGSVHQTIDALSR
jgi:hypothetical protein